MRKSILMLVLAVFSVLTICVVWQIGLWNVWVHNLNHPAGWQIFADIVIVLSLFVVWMWRDARANGRNPWPWAVLTLATGSFGPLLYLLTSRERSAA